MAKQVELEENELLLIRHLLSEHWHACQHPIRKAFVLKQDERVAELKKNLAAVEHLTAKLFL